MEATQQVKSKVPFSFGHPSDSENEEISKAPIVEKPAKKRFQFTKERRSQTIKVIIVPVANSSSFFCTKAAYKNTMNNYQQVNNCKVPITEYDDILTTSIKDSVSSN